MGPRGGDGQEQAQDDAGIGAMLHRPLHLLRHPPLPRGEYQPRGGPGANGSRSTSCEVVCIVNVALGQGVVLQKTSCFTPGVNV